MVREAWTDERLDDLSNRMDEGFREVRAELRQLRTEVGGVRTELGNEIGTVREELGEIRAEIKGMNRTMQVGFGLIGAVLTGILGLIAALLAAQL